MSGPLAALRLCCCRLPPVLSHWKPFWKLSLSAWSTSLLCLSDATEFPVWKWSMPLSLCFVTVSHLNLVILRGTHHTALWQDPDSRVELEGSTYVCSHWKWGAALINIVGWTLVLAQIIWDFRGRPWQDFCRVPACVLSAPNNQGMRGHWAR